MVDKLQDAIKHAMRNQQKHRVTTLRMLLSEVKKVAIDDRRKDVTEADLVTAVSKGIKQRTDSIAQFRSGGREDLATNEEIELEIYKEFQLQQLTDDEVSALVDKTITDMGISVKKEMGRLMAAINNQIVKGTVDMKKLSGIVMSKLK